MRGLVITLMAVDHSSGEFNAGRVMSDGALFFKPGTPLPAAQFFTRWITHLCAPTFVFLAGTSLAISLSRRTREGASAGSIDRHLFTRGLVIAAFEVVPSYFWVEPGKYLLQVLYAIGTSFLFMIPLRRLPTPVIAGLAALILCFGEAVTGMCGWGSPDATPLLASLLLVPGRHGHILVAYPTLYWLAIMLLGYCFGMGIHRGTDQETIKKRLLLGAGFLLSLFVVVRGLNGYGNMGLYREGSSLVQWLHVSKYPPSLSYATLELGIGALALWAIMGLVQRRPVSEKNLLLVVGRTPMFFYLLHIPALALVATVLGLAHRLGIGAAFGFAGLVTFVLYPLCLYYGRFKVEHPRTVLDYL